MAGTGLSEPPQWLVTGLSLQINSGLKTLNVSWNGFYLDGSKELSKALERNSTLQVLDLTANRINKECLNHIMKGLRHNTTLKVLKVRRSLSGVSARHRGRWAGVGRKSVCDGVGGGNSLTRKPYFTRIVA